MLIVVKFELFEPYYWIEVYELQYKKHKVRVKFMKSQMSDQVHFTVSTLNIRSILHRFHSATLSDLIDAYNPDLFCHTETRISHTTTPAELLNCTPPKTVRTSVVR